MGFRDYGSIIAPNGDYSANPKSGATGKYGFSWLYHGNDIRNITGVKDKAEFLNSPKAQEKYFEWYASNKLQPAVERLRSSGVNMDEGELAKLIHLRGESGAKKWIAQNPPAPAPVSPTPTIPAEQPQPTILPSPVPGVVEQQPVGNGQYSYEHVDRHGIRTPLHTGGPLTQDELDLAVNKSRNVIYQDQATNSVIAVRPGFYDNIDQLRQKEAAEYAGMNDPTKNINYKPPVEQVAAAPAAVPDPNFPTRDPVTGRVTPALNKRLADAAMAEQALNDEHAAAEKVEKKRSVTRRVLNGIFGNDSEGKPITHVE